MEVVNPTEFIESLHRSVEIFEMLKVSTMKPMIPRQKFQSCDLRVLETTTKEGWRTTRRLVISSSAGEMKPWCKEFCEFYCSRDWLKIAYKQ